jgi:hypothetical protein
VAPMFLKTLRRIASLGLVFVLALMVRNYLQFMLRQRLLEEDEKVSYYGRRPPTQKPTAEVLLDLFAGVMVNHVIEDGVVVERRHGTYFRLPAQCWIHTRSGLVKKRGDSEFVESGARVLFQLLERVELLQWRPIIDQRGHTVRRRAGAEAFGATASGLTCSAKRLVESRLRIQCPRSRAAWAGSGSLLRWAFRLLDATRIPRSGAMLLASGRG